MTPVYISITLNENFFIKNPIYNKSNNEEIANDIENFINNNEEVNQIINEDEEPICRICLEDGSQKPLISVCGCEGSSKYVHEECIVKWITRFPTTHTNYKKCEICKKNYNMSLIKIDTPGYLTPREKFILFILLNFIIFIIFFVISMALWV